MRRRRVLLVCLALLGPSSLVSVSFAGGLAGRAPGATVIVVSGGVRPAATIASGAWRIELPWLEHGDRDLAVSPDGTRIAFSGMRHGNAEIYVLTDDGAVTRLTTNPSAIDRRPAWSPDGRRIAWQSGAPGQADLYVMSADGSRKRRLVHGPGDDVEPDWAPDGRRIAYAATGGTAPGLYTVPAPGGRSTPVLRERASVGAPAWSPDGRRIAYARRSGARGDLWSVNVDTGAGKALTALRGTAREPDWSPDGRRLVFAVTGKDAGVWTVHGSGGPATPVLSARGDLDPEFARLSGGFVAEPDLRLPDLDQQAPRGIQLRAERDRWFLGFASATDNLGPGALRIVGSRRPRERTMRADQIIEADRGEHAVIEGVGRLRFEPHPPHEHWHLQPFVRYELRRASDGALVGEDRKTGFCLIDRYGRASKHVANVGPPRFVGDCETQKPDALTVEEGSSPGYVDRYPSFFHGQDIDVTGLKPGLYVLSQIANPALSIREARYSNNAASALVRLESGKSEDGAPVVTVVRRCPESAWCVPAES